MNIDLLALFAIVPIVFVISSLPISVGGHGVREGALVALLAASGVRFEAAATLSLLYLLVYLVSTTPGGFIELHRYLVPPSHAEVRGARYPVDVALGRHRSLAEMLSWLIESHKRMFSDVVGLA